MERPNKAIFDIFDKCEEIEGAREEGYRMFPDYQAIVDYINYLERKLNRVSMKAANILSSGFGCSECETCYALENGFECADINGWKEWLLKDE